MKKTLILLLVMVELVFSAPTEKGRIILKKVKAGSYLQYVPKSIKKNPQFLFLIHGFIEKDGDERYSSKVIIKKFRKCARKHRVVLIAPMFNQTNYGANSGPMGGYRSLQGRFYGAGEFLNQIADKYKKRFKQYDGRFFLVGHSAGGQMVSRYIHKYPERLNKAVSIASGSFFHLKPKVPYPNGYAWSVGSIKWPEEKNRSFEFKTTDDQIKKMIKIPYCAIIGTKDSLKIAKLEGHEGRTRITYAKSCISSIKNYAKNHKLKNNARLITVKDATHSINKMIPACVNFLFD